MALLVIILGVNYNAKAQSDTPTIPKPDANGKIVSFLKNGKEVCTWNPATLELTMTSLNGEVYKMDETSGQFLEGKGRKAVSHGSISNGGKIVSTNRGTMGSRLTRAGELYVEQSGKSIGKVEENSKAYIFHGANYQKVLLGQSSEKTNPLVVAYVYFALLLEDSERDQTVYTPVNSPSSSSFTSTTTSSSSNEEATKYEVFKKSSTAVGYVDSYGNVYDRYESKIGKLPKGNGDILDKSGSKIGEIYNGEIRKGSTVICRVDFQGSLLARYSSSSSFDIIGNVSDRVVARTPGESTQSEIGKCACGNKEWNAALIYCDFFF